MGKCVFRDLQATVRILPFPISDMESHWNVWSGGVTSFNLIEA